MFWHVFGKISCKFHGILCVFVGFRRFTWNLHLHNCTIQQKPCTCLCKVGTCLNSVWLLVCLLRFIFYFIIYIFRKISIPLSVLTHILLYAHDFKTFVSCTTPTPLYSLYSNIGQAPPPPREYDCLIAGQFVEMIHMCTRAIFVAWWFVFPLQTTRYSLANNCKNVKIDQN